MFGTHVYMTNIDVGGIFSVSAQTSLLENDNVSSKQDQVRQVHNNVIISHIFEDGKAESMETKENEIYEDVLAGSKIKITRRHFGGPQETCDFTKWKAELLNNPETWTVSNMEGISFDNCIGIWSFVKKHHISFSNAEQLSNFLAKTWHDHIAHGDMSNFLSSLWKTFVKDLKSTLSEPCSAKCHLGSLRELLLFLEKHVILVGKEVVTNVLDMSSETSVQKLFTESAQHKTPINICFQILTTKLKILQIDNGKSLAIGASWIASNYFILGLISQKEFKSVEELLELLESEFLPGIDALQAYSDIDLEKAQSSAKLELLNTIKKNLQSFLDRQEYQEALLLLVLSLSIGYNFKRQNILANITFEVLVTFIASAKGEIALARKYSENETREAWLLLRIIFKLDTNYRVFDASIVLVNQVNNFVSFLKDSGFVFHSNIANIIYSDTMKPHEVIHSLGEICRFPCVFGDGSMRTLHYKSPECCLDSANSDALHRMIKTFGMEKFFPQKLSTQQVLKLSNTLFTSPKKLEDIPWTIFRHAIAIDYNFRENILSDFLKMIRHNQMKSQKEDKEPTESNTEDKAPRESNKDDTQPTESNKEDKESTESNKEDKEPRESNKEDKESTESNKEDKEPRESNKEDKEPTESNKEDKEPRESNKDDKQPRQSNKDDTQPTESNKEDKESTESNKEDKEPRESNKEDKGPRESNKEGKEPIESNKDDKEPTESNKEDTQPTESNKEDKESTESNKEDKEPRESNKDDTQPTESNKEDKDSTESNKEDKEPSESNKEDKGPRESNKEGKEPIETSKEDKEPTENNKKDRQPSENNKDDTQLVKSKNEDRRLVKSKTEDIQRVKSTHEDRQLAKSKLEDIRLVKSKNEDKKLHKSKKEDTQIVKSKKVDTQLVKSKKDDTQLVKSKTVDRRPVIKSKIDGRQLTKNKHEDRQLIKCKNEDRKLVNSKNEDRQLVNRKNKDKQFAKSKVEGKRPAKGKHEDNKLVKSKKEGMQPAESKKGEIQLVQCKKEERQPAQSKKEERQPTQSKKEERQAAEKSISMKHNPMDVFLALWHCCDPFLKKILAAKIVTCKFALPLIYRNITTRQQLTISLWPIRDIFIDDSPDSVLNKSLKTVSFLRIGDLKVLSKSKIINKFLRGQNNEHNTFYHRDCPLGTNKRLVSNGLIEITWYVPRTDNDDVHSTETEEILEKLTQPLCILNMRGDAKCFRSQLLALLALSDVVVVMSEFDNLNDEQSLQVLQQIHNSSAFAIVMTNFPNLQQEEDELSGEDLQNFYETKTGLNSTNVSFLSTLLNESDLKDSLTVQITSALKSIIFPQSLEMKKLLLPTFVAIDEDNTQSKYGSDLSETIFADVEYSVNTMHRKQIKDKVLPLQGENLWHTWCLKQKECFRSVKKSVSDNYHHENLMKTLRLWQVMSCFENQSTIVKFINILERHIDDRDTITYFLQWMKLHMDCQSRQIIPKLSNDLYEAFRQYETLRSQGNADSKQMEELKLQIKSAEENLAKASFGLEHVFREMGQLYESFLYCNTAMKICLSTNTKRVIYKLPNIAAKLLCWGHPLEIMDGDAASVPESWIKAVLKEIRSIIKEDKTLYVISVLGIQSSGKSTLLNTMFGLQFSVSAGRCTRGIYAQLIPVDKSNSSLRFDYALVIDTEGLRAPELAGEKFNHDNELATLVIGLADVSIINIKGETIADMQDVLQIVVHALIRLKNANEKLNMKQSCVFVHQNVSASNARQNTFQGSQKVTSVLDEMTKHIAEQEKMANITQFTDVIAFNPVTNVIHVPDLWQGIPPMAPASPEYSKKVVKIANCILGDICESKKSFLNSENTSLHLENLWKGIISEDFVFSFRNALEVKAFTTLEMKFQTLVWTLQELKLEYLQNNLIQIGCSKTSEVLQSTITKIKDEFQKKLKTKTDLCDEELQNFFDNSDLSDYMIHWRARKTTELKTISSAIKLEIYTKIESERGKCEELFNTNRKLSTVKANVITKAVEFAKLEKNKAVEFAKLEKNKEDRMSEEDVKAQFEELWVEWLGELAPEVSENAIQQKIKEMEMQIENDMENKFASHQSVFGTVSKSMKLPSKNDFHTLIGCITEGDMNESDIEVIGIKDKVKRLFGSFVPENIKEYIIKSEMRYFEKTKKMLDRIFSHIENYIKTRQVEYNSAHFSQVLKYITDGFQTQNDASNVHEFLVTRKLEMKTTLMVGRYAVDQFTKHIERYEIQNSLRSKMTECKKEVESLFLGEYFETANEELATSIICDHLENALRQKLCRELHKQMWDQVTHSEFNNRKEPLIKAVLKDLAQKQKFCEYISYIEDSKSYVSTWIENYTKKLFEQTNDRDGSMFQQCIEKSLNTACVTIQKCANHAEAEGRKIDESLEQSVCWNLWINRFRDNLVAENLQMPPDCFQTLFHLKVDKIDNLIKNIEEKIELRRNSLRVTFKNKSLSQINWDDSDPYTEIMKTLWGCDKNCPWCLEPCVVASSEDRHACKQHRPEGIAGVHWRFSRKLVCESCDFAVQSDTKKSCGSWCKCDTKTGTYHPCKEFKNYMKESWDISGSSDMSSSKYWNWVFKTFEKDFVKHYKMNSPDFPNTDAFRVARNQAIDSLSMYK